MTNWFKTEIEDAARQWGLDPILVQAVVQVESSGRTNAYRYEPKYWDRYCAKNPLYSGQNPHRVAASYGLMQVMYPTAQMYGFMGEPERLFLPSVSLRYGCAHLAALLKWSYYNRDSALAAYNGGKRGNEIKPYRNQTYVDKVRAAIDEIERFNATFKETD